MQQIVIRKIRSEEWDDAMALVWRTFLRFEAPEYDQEGVQNFLNFISDERLRKMFLVGEYLVYGAFLAEELVGVISLRNASHISLLFVAREHHKKGIGRLLIGRMEEHVREESKKDCLTVHAAPYAVDFYRRVGFTATADQKKEDGILYTPMTKMIT